MTNGWNQGARKAPASARLWPGLSATVAGLQLSQVMLHYILCPMEGMLHPHTPHKPSGSTNSSVSLSSSLQCQWEAGMDMTSHGVCAPGKWDRQKKPTDVCYPGSAKVFPPYVVHVGKDLSDIPSCVFKQPLYIIKQKKKSEHHQVLSHWPNKHQAPCSCNPPQHKQLTWLSNPALDTHQPHDHFILHYRYISPQNMNMLKYPIMFWHACKKKKASPWQQRRQLANGSCCTHTQN